MLLQTDILPGIIASGVPALSAQEFTVLRDLIYRNTGIYFHEKKKYLLEGRVAKRLESVNCVRHAEYLDLVLDETAGRDERAQLFNVVTINETYFFRHEPQLEAMETDILPSLIRRAQNRGSRRIRIWSAACSTGEEPYSIAMMYLRRMRHRFPDIELEIVATDLSTAVLTKARRGTYSEYAMRNTRPEYRDAFFVHRDGGYELSPAVRSMIRFEHLNLYDRDRMAAMRQFDLILCCNVLIYFDTASKVQVVSDLYRSLQHGGHLIVGTSESLHGVSSAFKLVTFPRMVSYIKE